MLKARIAVFVSGGGTNLQALIDAQKSGVIKDGEIVLVVSAKRDAYALKRAEENSIPAVTVVRKRIMRTSFLQSLTRRRLTSSFWQDS